MGWLHSFFSVKTSFHLTLEGYILFMGTFSPYQRKQFRHSTNGGSDCLSNVAISAPISAPRNSDDRLRFISNLRSYEFSDNYQRFWKLRWLSEIWKLRWLSEIWKLRSSLLSFAYRKIHLHSCWPVGRITSTPKDMILHTCFKGKSIHSRDFVYLSLHNLA